MRSRRLVATLATAGLALAALSSCTKFDPSADEKPGLHQAVTISVNPKSKRQLLLAELYKQTLESQGRAANVASNEELEATSANEQNLPLIESGDGATNFYIGCTGELLDAFNPVAAREISKRYEEDQKDPSGGFFGYYPRGADECATAGPRGGRAFQRAGVQGSGAGSAAELRRGLLQGSF